MVIKIATMATIKEIDKYCSLCMDINCTGCEYHDVHFRNVKWLITMAATKLETKDIFDFKGEYKLAKCPPKEDGYYITIKCGLGGIYTTLNEWKNGEWGVLTTDDSDVIAYSREQVSKEDVKEWANAKLEKYRNKQL